MPRPKPLRSMGQGVTIAVTIFIAALLAFSGSVVISSINSSRDDTRQEALLASIAALTARNDRETCRAAAVVFKEQRTQIVQSRALLHAGLIKLSPTSLRLLDDLYAERYRRVTNSNLPVYCGDLRRWPNTIFKSKIVTQRGRVTPPLFQPFSGDLTMKLPGASPRPTVTPKRPQRPQEQPQTPSRPKNPSSPTPDTQKPIVPPLDGPVRPPDVTKPPEPPRVCVTVPLAALPPVCVL